MPRLSVIELFKEGMHFSAAHFTIFSSTLRENLHGHNYNLYTAFTAQIADEGLSFDYRFYKKKLYKLCQSLNETVLLPAKSKHLQIGNVEGYYEVQFADETLYFLNRDATLIPVTNITVEELSNWFVEQLTMEKEEMMQNHIERIDVKIFSSPGQSGSAMWVK